MAERRRSVRRDRRQPSRARFGTGDGIQFLKIAEKEIQRSFFAQVPVPELLNRICSALDCEIGNVVSLVSVLDDVATESAAMAGNAKDLGLHMFCSIGLVSANRGPLGKLELYSCEPGIPTRQELDLIKRAAWLAAIAIESAGERLEGNHTADGQMHLVRKQVLDYPETVN